MQDFLLIVVGYLMGTIPFAYVVTKLRSGTDIRDVGSGNVGATNVARALGIPWAITVFILDATKGALFILILKLIQPEWVLTQDISQLALLLPILGHCFSIFLGFKGGKGVATSSGIIAVISPWAFLCGAGAYLIGLKLSGHSFMGSFAALLTFLVLDLVWFHNFWPITLLVLTTLLLFQHRGNFKKLVG